MKKIIALITIIATAIAFGTFVVNTIKKAGLEDLFDLDLSEDIDDESRADYHERQVRNGLYIRTALLDYILYTSPLHRYYRS